MFQTLILTAFIAVTASVGAFIVAYKQGVKDGYNRGRAAGIRAATNRVKSYK
jgi:hypothetical protein